MCDLHALAREALVQASPRALQAGVDVALEGEAVQVRGAPELLSLALRNLIDNALAHTPAGGSVTLRLLQQGEGVQLQVQDSGTGLSAEQLARLGERFYRAGSLRPGSGLGLSIVRRVMALHGGSVAFHSQAGLCATLHFPPQL
jgi:signal transduction histidine kinase